MRKLSSVDDLLNPKLLGKMLGVSDITYRPLDTSGYSGARFFRVITSGPGRAETRIFVLKMVSLQNDWFSRRTGDTVGREASVLYEPALHDIRKIFHLPYAAVAVDDGRVGLLMDDVSRGLFPDERSPLQREDEDRLLESLARLHAHFWDRPEFKQIPWLHSASDLLHIMGPDDHDSTEMSGPDSQPIAQAVRTGWDIARDLLSPDLYGALAQPSSRIAKSYSDLPLTLVHGDTKVANFAIVPGDRICALDWAFAGCAPCTFDIGWYVAVNASRLTESKAAIFKRYRTYLERHLGRPLDDAMWMRMEEAGIVCGARMLLWSKAQGVKDERPGARQEWEWWTIRLQQWIDNAS